jgi:DNA modification methylase
MKAKILVGDVLHRISEISDGSVQCVVTSPPYWGLRDYGNDEQIGLEQNPQDYIDAMVKVFRQVKRVLANDGVLWINIGDSYSGSGKGPAGNLGKTHNERHLEHKTGGIVPEGMKPKDLVGIPWMLAFALRADGWYLRQDIIWHKPNPMPESVTDRCTKSHEYVFMLTKSVKYFFDAKAIEEPSKTKPGATWSERKAAGATAGNVIVGDGVRNGTQRVVHGKGVTSNLTRQDGMRNKRSVWSITTKPFKGAHFAVMPEALVEPCVLASSRIGDTVFDPFSGSGTVGVVSNRLGRDYIGCELNGEYAKLSRERLEDANGLYAEVEVM